MFAAKDVSYALVKARDYAYTQPAALPVPRPRIPCPSQHRRVCLSMSSSVRLPKDDLPARCARTYIPCTQGVVSLNGIHHRGVDTGRTEVTGRNW